MLVHIYPKYWDPLTITTLQAFLADGMVGWCKGAVYLTSPGRPADIGLIQLGKAWYPCSR